jgi:hypothetical protein
MLFGGTNFDDWGGRNLTTTYDYNAPIRENGGVGERYQRVRSLGQMIREHGAKLVRSRSVEIEAKTTDRDVKIADRRAADGSRYIFVRTDNHNASRAGTAQLNEKDGATFSFDYKLEPFGSLVLYMPPAETDARKGEWLPKPAPEIKRPSNLPAPVTINEAQRLTDALPTAWTSLAPAEPIEARNLFGSHFVYYKISAEPGATVTLEVLPGDAVIGRAGDKNLAAVVSKDKKHFAFRLPPDAKELVVLHEKLGHRNGPTGMEKGGTYGLLSVQGVKEDAPIQFAEGGTGGKEREFGEALSRGETKPGGGWKSASIGQDATPAPEALLTWYRMHFALPSPEQGVWVPWHLHLEAKGNGFLYVNGHCLGRYWEAGPQRDFYIPETWLNFGRGKTNTAVLNLRPVEKGVRLQSAQIVPDTAFAEFR